MSQLNDASLPNSIEGFKQELEIIEAEQAAVVAELQKLMQAEDPSNGVYFAKEIHELRQTKVKLQFQHQLRVARINRMNLAW